jgi:hypothetical protein
MGKAGTKKPKPKPKIKLTDKEQSERFIEAARTIGADPTPQQFDDLFGKLVPPKRPRKNE